MSLAFKIVPASECSKYDVISAIDIYLKSVDPESLTDSNEISDHIFNPKKYKNDKRKMFFYVLYAFTKENKYEVVGLSEFGYLPKNQTLVLDYICTEKRNHLFFYAFYTMVIEDIKENLLSKNQYIRYIITELSLKKDGEKLIDNDSNYFRHMLSNENFKLLKLPYYQPPLSENQDPQEFNIAISNIAYNDNTFALSKENYLSIIKELYYSHYLEWYKSYYKESLFKKTLDELFERINSEIPKNVNNLSINFIQCKLFEDGECPKFTAENITIPREKEKQKRKYYVIFSWLLLSIVTFIVCICPKFSKIVNVSCSLLTIIAGIFSLILLKRDIFSN